jgi:hypothetical protein
MDKAVLMVGDHVQMFAVDDLYELLIENQGKEAGFTVLRDKKYIVIRVKVPELELPFRRVCFCFEKGKSIVSTRENTIFFS